MTKFRLWEGWSDVGGGDRFEITQDYNMADDIEVTEDGNYLLFADLGEAVEWVMKNVISPIVRGADAYETDWSIEHVYIMTSCSELCRAGVEQDVQSLIEECEDYPDECEECEGRHYYVEVEEVNTE